MEHIKNCPRCNGVIVKALGDQVKIRSKMIIHKHGKMWAACSDCGYESEVPLLLNESMVKSLQEAHRTAPVPLYVRSNRKVVDR